MDWGWSGIAALIVTILAALLYAAGRAWRDSFLGTLGVQADSLPVSFQDQVYIGALIQLKTIVIHLAISLAVVFSIGLFISGGHSLLNLLEDWATPKFRSKALPHRAKLLPLAHRIEMFELRFNPYLAVATTLVVLLMILGYFIYFIDAARLEGERHATEVLVEMQKGSKARMGYPSVRVLKASGEEMTRGFAVMGSDKSVVVVGLHEGAVTAKLHTLSADVIVEGKR